MFFRPSAARVAKEVYTRTPSMAGKITASVGSDYEEIEELVRENSLFQEFMIELTAESMFTGMTELRGERFGAKLREKYGFLSPARDAVVLCCINAIDAGLSEEMGLAIAILSDTEHQEDVDAIARLERFIVIYRAAALKISEMSVAAYRA